MYIHFAPSEWVKRDGINLHHQRCWDFKIPLTLASGQSMCVQNLRQILIQIRFWWYSSAISNEWYVNMCGWWSCKSPYVHIHIDLHREEWVCRLNVKHFLPPPPLMTHLFSSLGWMFVISQANRLPSIIFHSQHQLFPNYHVFVCAYHNMCIIVLHKSRRRTHIYANIYNNLQFNRRLNINFAAITRKYSILIVNIASNDDTLITPSHNMQTSSPTYAYAL